MKDPELNDDNEQSPLERALNVLGWMMGLEPTTTGITILDSTN